MLFGSVEPLCLIPRPLMSDELPKSLVTPGASGLERINRLNDSYEHSYARYFQRPIALNRMLVSFQASKTRSRYRWYKYKEAFSAELVEFFLQKYGVASGVTLDPFAGTGTTMFAAQSMGLDSEGIELLPIGQAVIQARRLAETGLSRKEIETIESWGKKHVWQRHKALSAINELKITAGAYPDEAVVGIGKYVSAISQLDNHRLETLLRFALLCVLESVSYTRKDGQYLRWDYRSGRRQGKKRFDKGEIPDFKQAISKKLLEIVCDLRSDSSNGLLSGSSDHGRVKLHSGSCLDILPRLETASYDFIMTSPPYCNRYDYTRTYALELALLGVEEKELTGLRQSMLSCTVENREKNLLRLNPAWSTALNAAGTQPLLGEILRYLQDMKDRDLLNNNGIPRMVKGYFFEMACVISECARVLKRDARLVMVNDNVRYSGAGISVDIILSEIAKAVGFETESILVLPRAKGNSSQQMGEHGRSPLRKCVYVWRKA